MMRHLSLILVALVVVASGCRSDAELTPVQISGERLMVEVADTPEERRQGLMNRESLPQNRGMLFVYESEDYRSFWMKNTEIPLSIAFISADGIIMEIKDMTPFSLDSVESTHRVKYALEVNQGTFERLGIEVGAEILFPEGPPR